MDEMADRSRVADQPGAGLDPFIVESLTATRVSGYAKDPWRFDVKDS